MQPKNCIAVSLFIGQRWRITPTLSWGERCFLVHFVDRVAEHSEATLPCKNETPVGFVRYVPFILSPLNTH